ncbi:transcriptional regulator, Fis family [Alloactinosynnema sp. L-07]|uniref:hypothetical protein n=1 Tax=Alloactinosynnema sp. L-07 TaxID=1653480 RepID=UPI00065F048B|nr:hypothetical protein [Alloactinosynnema sp. L-07]CRK61199.1 transcriptional regulator, Fis family [Alloactinosynnema sp. L-07]
MPTTSAARFSQDVTAIVIDTVLDEADIVREARRWTTGERGPIVDDSDALRRADLRPFVTEAMRMGAHALSVLGQAHEAQAVGRLLDSVGDKTTESVARAAELTDHAIRAASDTVSKAATDARTAILEADATSRKEFTTAVAQAKADLTGELRRLFGGERPELVDRIQPLLDKFGSDLDAKVGSSARELLDQAVKQLDPGDPSSPMAKYTAHLTANQTELADRLTKSQGELTAKIDELATVVRVREATSALAQVTPLKGESFAARVNLVMAGIAAGLGGEYLDTSTTVGALPRCRKGDGLLSTDDGAARVVIETSDSTRRDWGGYLDEAERNRGAATSLGIVRTPEQNGGATVRLIGSRRVVLAFDPDTDDPDLLRTVVQLLRIAALSVTARTGDQEIATAEEKIGEAMDQLERIDTIKRAAGTIKAGAEKIDRECAGVTSAIRRTLGEALNALAGTSAPATDSAA